MTSNRVAMRVIKRALRKMVSERLVKAVMSMYKRAKTRVQVEEGHLEDLGVDVGVYQR